MSVEDKAYNQVRNEVNNLQIFNNVFYENHKQIGNQVNLQIWNLVYDRIDEQIRGSVRHQVQLLVCEIIKNILKN